MAQKGPEVEENHSSRKVRGLTPASYRAEEYTVVYNSAKSRERQITQLCNKSTLGCQCSATPTATTHIMSWEYIIVAAFIHFSLLLHSHSFPFLFSSTLINMENRKKIHNTVLLEPLNCQGLKFFF